MRTAPPPRDQDHEDALPDDEDDYHVPHHAPAGDVVTKHTTNIIDDRVFRFRPHADD